LALAQSEPRDSDLEGDGQIRASHELVGDTFLAMGRPQDSASSYQGALSILEPQSDEINDDSLYQFASLHSKCGSAFLAQRDLKAAAASFEKAGQFALRKTPPRGLSSAWFLGLAQSEQAVGEGLLGFGAAGSGLAAVR